MDNKKFAELLKEHYATNELPGSRVKDILDGCEMARVAHRWKTRALGAGALATAALVALGVVMITFETPDPEVIPVVIDDPAPKVPEVDDHRLLAVMIHHTDCANSQAMDPVFVKLQETFIDESVLFIKFDYSSDCAKHQAEMLSENLGLKTVFEKYKRTGDIILVSSCGDVRGVVNRGEGIVSATSVFREKLREF